ncbi:MAG: TlpA family protein disulfide reductase [Flammeovirgaceae bacterium]|jgi:thiol-disulfide isomerase/thioredoxin|nr:TlpA family protein disulfide reductase [Flammeovirgaceae bacterium]
MKILKEVLKTGLTLVILLVVLNYTGLIGSISSATQSAILKTGLLDAEVDVSRSEIFNYDFTIKDLAGNKFSFGQYKSKVVFVNLWATWCGPCRAEMAGIQKLYSSIASDSISFVMLSLDRDTDQEKVVKYVNTKGFTFPVYLPSGRLTEQLSVPSIPTTFVIGKDGRIVAKEVGTTNFNTDKFKKFLKQLKEERH